MTHASYNRIRIGLFLTILGGYVLFTPAHFLTSPDEELNLRTTLSFLQGGGGAIPSLEGFASKTGRNGREYAQYGLGLPLASLSWCVLGTTIDPTPNKEETNTLERYYDAAQSGGLVGTAFLRGWMSGFNMIVSALTVVLVFSIALRLGLPPRNATFVSLLLAFCCYTWPHGRTFFTEPLAAFCLTAAVWSFLKSRENPAQSRWILCAGFFWAYAVLTRLDSLATAPAAAWFLFTESKQGKFELNLRWNHLILFAIPWVIVLGAILGYNVHRFGSVVSTGYEDQPEKIRFVTPLLVGLHGFLFTPGRSIFLYSPPLILALLGIGRFWKKDAWVAGGVFLLIAGYLGAMSKWQNWAGGYDWGPRHVYQITPFLAIVAGAWIGERALFDHPAKRIAWVTGGIVSLFIQLLGLSADSIFIIKWFLSRMMQSIPPENANSVAPYLMQLPVYLPQFSSPALHWQWTMDHGLDLLILRTASFGETVFFLIPLGAAGLGGYLLWAERNVQSRRKTPIS